MNQPIRTERRFGVTSELTQQQRVNLLKMRNEDGWQDVLDVMEMTCIEIETALINTSSDKETEVLANHKMAKAAWLIFTHLQEKIDLEISLYLESIAKKPPVPEMTWAEQEAENILDPTRPAPYSLEN
jgi:hypothetical protein